MTVLRYRVYCLIAAGDTDAAAIAAKLGRPLRQIRIACKDLRKRGQIVNVGNRSGGSGNLGVWVAVPGAVVQEDGRGKNQNPRSRRNLALGPAVSAKRNARAGVVVPGTMLERCWRMA